LSVGSIGSVGSILSIGSAGSAASVLSAGSRAYAVGGQAGRLLGQPAVARQLILDGVWGAQTRSAPRTAAQR
jgi:hypothetical protein